MLVLEGALAQLQRLGLINCLRHNETLKFASQLYGLLEIASEDWKLYGAEVSALSDRIRVLQSEQDALQEQISLARAYLAPVRRLPVEILLEIFEFACCEGFGLYGTTLSQELPDVLSISSVCTSWRKAAIRTPSLWAGLIATSIARHPVTRMDRPRRLHAQFIQTLYGRTRGIKLTIPLLNDKATLDFFQPFLPQADCCLALYPQGYAQLLQFLNAMPNLRELKLDMQCSPIELKLSEREIPSLVHLRKVEVSEKLGLPWAQLTELTLSWMTAATASSILPHCSAIEHLSLNFIMYEENDYHHLPITLPKLRSLSLMLSSNQQQSYALDGLRIPGLASIALYESLSEIHRSLDIPNSIPSLLKRSQAHYPLIRFLFIPPVFWHFFEKCRHLLDLSISSGEHLVRALHIDLDKMLEPDKVFFLPHLEELALAFDDFSSTDEDFVDMVVSRWKALEYSPQHSGLSSVARLASVQLQTICGNFDNSQWDRLRILQKEGLRISVGDGDGDVRTRIEAQAQTDIV